MPVKTRQVKYVDIVYIAVSLLFFFYVLFRAIKVGATYDEVWTIEGFVPRKFIEIINYTPCDANNHILNTLLIKLLFAFDNQSLSVARLPNVLAFLVYLYFSYKISRKYLSSFIGIVCFLLVLLNPFLLDFFSLARGYGLSLAFLLASLYFIFNFVNDGSSSNIWKALGLGAVGVLCNFSLLNYWLSLVCVINIIAIFSKSRYSFKKTFSYSLIIAIFLAAILFEPIRKLLHNGNLYYGGNTSFYSDTLVSLAKYTFYSPEVNQPIYYALNGFLFLLILSIIGSFFLESKLHSSKNVILLIAVFCVLSVVSQHYLFGTLYLIDRTALFFYPLFILLLCFSLDSLRFSFKNVLVVLVTIMFFLNFLFKANFHKTALWYFDAHTSEILRLIDEKGKKQHRKLKLDFSWPFQSAIGYYNRQNKYDFIEIVKNQKDREDLNSDANYYIYLDKSLEKVGYDANNQKINALHKDTTVQYKSESIIVFKSISKWR